MTLTVDETRVFACTGHTANTQIRQPDGAAFAAYVQAAQTRAQETASTSPTVADSPASNSASEPYPIRQVLMNETYPLHMEIGEMLQQLRDLFDDIGMPIIDGFQLQQMPDGQFKVEGWGKGVTVSHPQKDVLEAILNGKIPELSEQSEKIGKLIDKMENLFGRIRDIDEKNAPLIGREYMHKHSTFKDGVNVASLYSGQVQDDARELSMKFKDKFQAFKSSLGDELDKLDYTQVLSRFYFETVTKPNLPEIYDAFYPRDHLA